MRRHSILHAIPLSFFSRGLYRDVAASWRGFGLVYLLLVVGILTLIVMVRMQAGLSRWARGPGNELADQIPAIAIRHRVVEVDRPMPYVIQDREKNREIAIVDTTGRITSLDGLEAGLLLTADHLFYRKSAAEIRVFNLSSVERFTITSSKAKRWLALLTAWASPVIGPFVLGGLFLFRLAQALVFALAALLVARLAKLRLDFAALMRISVVALTPVLLLEPLLDIAGWKPPAWGLIWTTIALAYVIWGVLANRPAVAETPVTEIGQESDATQ